MQLICCISSKEIVKARPVSTDKGRREAIHARNNNAILTIVRSSGLLTGRVLTLDWSSRPVGNCLSRASSPDVLSVVGGFFSYSLRYGEENVFDVITLTRLRYPSMRLYKTGTIPMQQPGDTRHQ